MPPISLPDDHTPLMAAAASGDAQSVKRLLAAGVDVGVQTSKQQTALTLAARYEQVDMIHLLCTHTPDGQLHGTALLSAAAHGRLEVAQALIAHWPAHEALPAPVLYLAAHQGNLEMVKLLVAHGAATDNFANGHTTPLMAAAQHNNATVVDFLLDRGVALEDKNQDGNTALGLATQNWHHLIVKALLDAGADPNCQNHTGGTPLMMALWHTQAEENNHFHLAQLCVLALLDGGARWEMTSDTGKNALQMAAGCKNDWALGALLDHGADIHTQDSCGRGLLYYASVECQPTIRGRLEQAALEATTVTGAPKGRAARL